MRRNRGFTLIEATTSLLILSVVMVVALTLLVSMRSFAAKQYSFTAPRQTARSAVDYLSYFIAGASDLNADQGNPNALVMWTTFGDDSTPVVRQASYNNLTATQAADGFGDEGTDIVTLAVATNPVRMPIAGWSGNDPTSNALSVNFTAGCPDDTVNLQRFKNATGARIAGANEVSGLLVVQDVEGRWRYMQISRYVSSTCSEMGGTDAVIVAEVIPGNTDQINPPGGWRSDLLEPCTLNAGIDFTSFRVRNRNLEQKLSGVDGSGTYSPGVFDPDCDRGSPGAGCPSIGFTPVVENVEDLQVAYVFTDGSVWNTATQQLATAGGIPGQAVTLAGAPGAQDVVNVRALRVSVIARSNQLDIGARGLSASLATGLYRRVALEDHAQGPVDTVANGVFERYRLTTTLLLRNRMLGL